MKNVILVAVLVVAIAVAAIYVGDQAHRQTAVATVPQLPLALPTHPDGASRMKVTGVGEMSMSDYTVGKIAAFLTGVFNVKPHQEQKTVLAVQASHDVLTYTFVRDDQYAEQETENTHLGSTKELKIWATYHCDVGVDLNERLTVNIQDKNVTICYPRPHVIATELADFGMWSDGGLWNWIDEDERVTMLKQLQSQAKLTASRKEALNRASQRFEDHMRAMIQMIDPTLSVSFVPLAQVSPVQ